MRLRAGVDRTAGHGVTPLTGLVSRGGLSQFLPRCQGGICSAGLEKSRPIREHNAMSANDFDIHTLARYLHLAPQQVAKLADRGKLPGRKVGGAVAVRQGRHPSLAGKPDRTVRRGRTGGSRGRFAALGPRRHAGGGDLHRRHASPGGDRHSPARPDAKLGDRLDGRAGRRDRLALGLRRRWPTPSVSRRNALHGAGKRRGAACTPGGPWPRSSASPSWPSG